MLLRNSIVLLVTCAVFQAFPVRGSEIGDSLRYVLDADASMTERAKAIMGHANLIRERDPAGALDHASNAVRFAEQTGDPMLEHETLVLLRTIQLQLGLYTDHLRTTLRSLEVSRALADPELLSADLRDLSTAYRMNKRKDKAVDEARNALAMALPTKNVASISAGHRFLMLALMDAGRHDEALLLGSSALLLGMKDGANGSDNARVRTIMARVLLAQNKFAEAQPMLASADLVLGPGAGLDERYLVKIARSQASIGLGQFAEAQRFLNEAEALSAMSHNASRKALMLNARYELAKASQDWQKALALHEELMQNADSMHQAGTDLALAGMQVTYEVAEREKVNTDLRGINEANEITIADQRDHNSLLRMGAFGLLVLVIALVITGVRNLRLARLTRIKKDLIQRQKDEIHGKNMELQRQNMRLAESLVSEEGKDIVIKEIHHRVKNNLQVVDSLLHIQIAGSNEPGVDRFLKEAQGRIRAMALVHDSIYRNGDALAVPVRSHMEQLARNVIATHGKHDSTSVVIDIPEMTITAEDLMPLSLVVNELMTNAVKYAFTGMETGCMRIVIRPSGDGYELLFSDNGKGADPIPHEFSGRSFGLELVKALATQLNGEFKILSGAGTTYCLTFKPEGAAIRLAS